MAMPMLRAIGTTPLLFLICCYTEGRDFWRAVSRSDLKILALLGTILCCGTQNLFNIGLQLTTATDGGMSVRTHTPQKTKSKTDCTACKGARRVSVQRVSICSRSRFVVCVPPVQQPAVPVFAAFMSILLGREKSSWGKVCGIGCAILGTLCIVLGETYLLPASASPSDEDPSSALTSGGGSASANGNDLHDVSPAHRVLGLLCFTLQTFLFAVYMLLQKPLLARLPTLTITFYTFFFGQVGASLVGGYFVAQIDWAHLPIMWFVSVAYTILFSTVAGFLLFGYATKHLPATAASTGITLQPLFSSVLGAIVLGDVITYMHIVGGLFLIAGLIIVIRARSKEARQATREATDTAAAEALAAATAAQEDLSSTAPLPSSSSSVEEEFGTTTSLERADEAVQEHEEAEELMIELAHRGGGSSGVPPRLPSDGHPVPTEAKTSRLSFDENPFEL
jgi:drug/metabolite transporter (DMT)-like permease